MGVSCTPVLTALRRLEYDGLIISRPRSGFYMPVFDEAAVNETTDALNMIYLTVFSEIIDNHDNAYIDRLEDLAHLAQSAYEAKDFTEYIQQDREFHRTVVAYLHNDRIMQFYNRLHRQMEISSSADERGIDRMHPETHFLWCELLRKQDLPGLKELLKIYKERN